MHEEQRGNERDESVVTPGLTLTYTYNVSGLKKVK